MSTRVKFLSSLFLLMFLCSCSSNLSSDQADVVNVTDKNQTNVAITVYNNNLGLVKDTREVTLDKGIYNVNFKDVSGQIIPSSVHVKSLDTPDDFFILEQNYEYDLINADKLMNKYVGKKIKLIFKSRYSGEEEEREALLLSNNKNPIYKIDGEIHLGFPGRIILPKIPDDLLAKPTLVWLIDNKNDKKQKLEVSYLTDGISWHCDYVLILSKNDKSADMTSWVTINNNSGTSYKNATVKLVAGDVKREKLRRQVNKAGLFYETDMSPRAPQFQEEGFFEYHLYMLQRKTTIKQNQIKQIVLFEKNGLDINKKFMIYGQNYYYTSAYRQPIKTIPVQVTLELENSEQNKLAIPLPKGLVRVYKEDNAGMLQFAGEHSIKHTPKNEKIKLKIGKAFDITAERKQSNFKKIGKNLYEVEWEITVRNHKDEDIVVTAEEPLPGDWTIIEKTHDFKKISTNVIHFELPVKKDKQTVLRYRAKIKTDY
ncbi:DUF4139 domain-containing protein [bacterium]|nr:DUF4139 domain-containing protein [bacterium]